MAVGMKRWFAGAATAAGVVGGLILAQPAWVAFTIDFGNKGGLAPSYTEKGFRFTPGNRLTSQCPPNGSGGACLFINTGTEPSIEMERTSDGVEFDLLSFSYNFPQGAERKLTVTEDDDPTPSQVINFGGGTSGAGVFSNQFNGVRTITFALSGGGSVRMDNFVVTPLLAAAWMMIAGLGVLGGVAGRRRRAAAAAG